MTIVVKTNIKLLCSVISAVLFKNRKIFKLTFTYGNKVFVLQLTFIIPISLQPYGEDFCNLKLRIS